MMPICLYYNRKKRHEPKEMRFMSAGDSPKEVCESIKEQEANFYGGIKYDQNKLRYDLVPVEPIEAVAKIITYGAKKYKPNNWQRVEMWRYIGAFMRHWFAWLMGEDLDSESGEHHIDHALCNLFFIKWKLKHGDIK